MAVRRAYRQREVSEPQANGWLIQCQRARKGLTRAALAALLGTPGGEASLLRIERGLERVGPRKLARLATALGVTVESLQADPHKRLALAVQRLRWIDAGEPKLALWLKSEGL